MAIIKSVSTQAVVFVGICFCQNIFAEGFDYYEHINKYTKCEAVQNVVANILSETEEKFYQHESHHASLDSRIIALEFARAGKYEEGLIDELYHTYLDAYRDLLEQSEDVEKFTASLKPQVTKCKKLNEMQEDILRRKRQEKINNK
ncbi:MAG: hypothetical protein R8G33_08185 [Gammaproteobacteria bacterium]|nr:hypothetical protein [Gammaproteobacteria bacterium]